MKKNRLGTSDLFVSEIGLGCMSLPEDEQTSERIVHAALDAGIHFFDTADLYGQGRNEEQLGRALYGRRHEVIVASKVGHLFVPGVAGFHYHPTKAHILSAVHDSLRRLGTDYIDLYQLHGGMLEDPFDEIVEAFEELLQDGVIRAYGISSIRPAVIRQYLRQANIASVMMQYSLLDRRPEETMLTELQAAGVSMIGRGALAGGWLAGRVPDSETGYLDYTPAQLREVIAGLSDMAGGQRSAKRELGQLAIRYALAHPTVATIVVGASSVAQVTANASATQAPELSQAELIDLRALSKKSVYNAHR